MNVIGSNNNIDLIFNPDDRFINSDIGNFRNTYETFLKINRLYEKCIKSIFNFTLPRVYSSKVKNANELLVEIKRLLDRSDSLGETYSLGESFNIEKSENHVFIPHIIARIKFDIYKIMINHLRIYLRFFYKDHKKFFRVSDDPNSPYSFKLDDISKYVLSEMQSKCKKKGKTLNNTGTGNVKRNLSNTLRNFFRIKGKTLNKPGNRTRRGNVNNHEGGNVNNTERGNVNNHENVFKNGHVNENY
jgi:hypothetical protein